MDSYNLADAKAQFSDLVARAEAGEEIEIKRRGEPVARLVPIAKPKQKLDIEALRRLTEGQEMGSGAGQFMRQLRDGYRY